MPVELDPAASTDGWGVVIEYWYPMVLFAGNEFQASQAAKL